MKYQVFTPPWLDAWADEIRASSAYREAASGWEGALALVLESRQLGRPRVAVLDLWHGDCRSARAADVDALDEVRFALAGSDRTWRKVLGGSDPLWALMSGKLKLHKGSLAELTPWAKAAKELVRTAGRIPTAFPGEEGISQAPTVAPEVASPPPVPPPVPAAAPSDTAPEDGAPRHRTYRSTSPEGLDFESLPMRLFQKSKKFGIWDPAAIDLEQDRRDWEAMSDLEQEVILHLTSLFQAGEESVTLDLLPLVMVIASEGRLEEEMYLTSFLWEEAKHVELFRRFVNEVAHDASDLSRFHTPSYLRIFSEALPEAMGALLTDRSPRAQAVASATYNMIVEGVLAETGYHAYHRILVRNDLMPGMQTALGHLERDESRHIAYGVHLLTRLVHEHGAPVREAIEAHMEELLPVALGMIEEIFERYETMPFGLELADFTDFATSQFQRRLRRIESGRPFDATDDTETAG